MSKIYNKIGKERKKEKRVYHSKLYDGYNIKIYSYINQQSSIRSDHYKNLLY